MKKFLALLLALVMALGLGACAFDIGGNSGFGGSKTPAAKPTELTEETLTGTWAANLTARDVIAMGITGMDSSEDKQLAELMIEKAPANLDMEILFVCDGEDCYNLVNVEEFKELFIEIVETTYTADVYRKACGIFDMSEEEFLAETGCASFEEVAEKTKSRMMMRIDEEIEATLAFDTALSESRNGFAIGMVDYWQIVGNELYLSDDGEEMCYKYDGTSLNVAITDRVNLTYKHISNKTDY